MFKAVNHADKQVIVSFKGTSRGSDFVHDGINVVLGAGVTELTGQLAKTFDLPHRFNSALSFTNEARNKHPGYSVILTGHSLGGTLAENVAMQTGFRCETFNAGSTPFNLLGSILVGHKFTNIK